MRRIRETLLTLTMLAAAVCVCLPIRGAATYHELFKLPYFLSEHVALVLAQVVGPVLTLGSCLHLLAFMRSPVHLPYSVLALSLIGPVYTFRAIGYTSHDFSHTIFHECSSVYGNVIASLSLASGLLILAGFLIHARWFTPRG